MKELSLEKMEELNGGSFWGCVAGVAGAVAVTTVTVGALTNPVGWALVASDWYLIASAGALSAVTIYNEC